MAARIKVRAGKTTVQYPPGRPPTPAKGKNYYRGKLPHGEGRKLAAQMSPEERDRLGRRQLRMLTRGQREERALVAALKREDVERSGFWMGRVKT